MNKIIFLSKARELFAKDGYEFPKPTPIEDARGPELLVQRFLKSPSSLTYSEDVLLLGFLDALQRYPAVDAASQGGIPLSALVGSRSVIQKRLLERLGGKVGHAVEKGHPENMNSQWTWEQAANYLLRALAHEGIVRKTAH